MTAVPAPGQALRLVSDVLDQMPVPAADSQIRALETELAAAPGTR